MTRGFPWNVAFSQKEVFPIPRQHSDSPLVTVPTHNNINTMAGWETTVWDIGLTLWCWILFAKHKNIIIFMIILRWHNKLKSFLMEDKDLFILYSQYHGCWWPDDTQSQGIISHGSDLVCPKYSGFSTRGTNSVVLGAMALFWRCNLLIVKQFVVINTLRPRQNGRHFQMHIPEWKRINFDSDFTEVCSQGSN